MKGTTYHNGQSNSYRQFHIMPEAGSLLLRAYGSSPQMKIIDYLMDYPKNDFTQKEIIESLGMSKTTFYKYFNNLVEFGMVKVNRKIANAKLYSINTGSPVVQNIRKNVDYISEKIAELEEQKLKKPIPAK
ncbi:MAG: winged helix-turn-helix domain-containing protein [Nitrosotalea sp.]